MDRTTEPVIAVLGHPIAGNAAQFALERAFAVMQLDWRVLSFDVSPEQLHVALDGLDVLGVEGVLIDENLSEAASCWARERIGPDAPVADLQPTGTSESSEAGETKYGARSNDEPFDILYRGHAPTVTDLATTWSTSHAAATWLHDTTREHFESRGEPILRWSLVGTGAPTLLAALSPLTAQSEQVPLESDVLDSIDLVVIAPSDTGSPKPWPASQQRSSERPYFDDWPQSNSSTLVIDLCGVSVPESFAERGYRVITADELQAGMLSRCLEKWTHQPSPIDVLREAIEEYSAV